MKSLERLEVPQNGVKKDGMIALFAALKENLQLQTLVVNDNWIKKGEAADGLNELVKTAVNLRKLDVSDNDMGAKVFVSLMKALKVSKAALRISSL